MNVYIQAVNGKFYQNPVLYGPDWTMRYKDVEWVIQCKNRKRAILARRENDLPIKIYSNSAVTQKIIINGKFIDGMEFSCEPIGPIPIPTNYDSVVDRPGDQDVIYGFWLDFDSETIYRALKDIEFDTLLLRVLTGNVDMSLKSLAKRRIYRNFPEFRNSGTTGTFRFKFYRRG